MPQKILIVEDEEDFRSLLEGVLQKAGYSVVSAPSGEEGLRVYGEESPDLLLLDMHLPDMEGHTICRRIRAEGPRPETPIVFCTVRSSIGGVAEGLNAGGTDYIVKPFETKDLLARVASALKPEAS